MGEGQIMNRFIFLCWFVLTILSSGSAQAAQPLTDAAWRVTATGVEDQGIHHLDGADGVTRFEMRGGQRCLANQTGTTPASQFLYFALDDDRANGMQGPVYLVVDYFDEALGGILTLHYDSNKGDALVDRYQPAEDQAGGWAMGTGQWKTAAFLLQNPRFTHRQNLGADFRLAGTRLFIRSLHLASTRPLNWDQLNRVQPVDVKPLVKIGNKGQLIVGGFDPAQVSDAGPQSRALEASVPALQSLGVTSHEGYVRWNLCEPQPGHYDWSVYDKFVQVYQRHHLKWVPFLIIGSAYSLPDWYYKQPGSQGYVCLEHGQESDVQSLWNPALRGHVARFIQAFCEHYRKTGVIESILLGITGNYGEAIYVATEGTGWTAGAHGDYHAHPGFWAGDPYAVQSFQQWLTHKYGNTQNLRAAWGTQADTIISIGAVRPFLRKDAPSDRAWLDFVDWYIGSMNDWASFWMHTTRQYFPKGDIYLCTGGHAPPEHGANFGQQCKIAAEVGGGVRITNEGSDYRNNFSLTRWVAAAGRQYGAYFSFEPAGDVNPNGVIARIYNATASGARGLHYYYPNLYATDAARDNFVRYGSQFQQRRPIVQIAVYYPQTYIKLNGNDFLPYVQPLRDRFDFDYMSDEQIADGGLRNIKALILLHGNVAEASAWRNINNWVQHGGLLLYPDGMGRLRTVEGDESVHDVLLGANANHGKGRVVAFSGTGNSPEYRSFLARTLASSPELSGQSRAMVAADGEEDNTFVTLCAPNELLWLNYTNQEVHKVGMSPLTLPPYAIVSQRLGKR